MQRIGIIADTHGYLDPVVLKYFAACDEIWHAGDFGSMEVVEHLRGCRPLRGVHGNIDDAVIRAMFPRDVEFPCEGLSVWLTHIAGRPGRYDPRVRKRLATHRPDL
ncbi:MAG TPA: metallophosphoesterase family protein, partial [Pirellulaceae bacterium]